MSEVTHNSDHTPSDDHHGAIDDWHDHAADPKPQHVHGETSPVVIAGIGLVGFAFVIVTIVAIVIYFDQVLRNEVVVKVEKTNVAGEYQAKMATWQGELSSYGWVDAQNGVVRIPAERAAELVAQEYSARR